MIIARRGPSSDVLTLGEFDGFNIPSSEACAVPHGARPREKVRQSKGH
jgi:hypothetical protein